MSPAKFDRIPVHLGGPIIDIKIFLYFILLKVILDDEWFLITSEHKEWIASVFICEIIETDRPLCVTT